MAWNSGLWWPWGQRPGFFTGSGVTLDATGEYVAFIGYLNIAGQATSKTIDTTGSSSIMFAVGGSPVFDNASSVATVGFQGADVTTGFPTRPDGTWAARAVITTAANTTPALTISSDFHTVVPTAGTNTFSHGELCCFVIEMTTRAGSDSLVVSTSGVVPGQSAMSLLSPAVVSNTTGSVANVTTTLSANLLITFSDGTIGTMEGTALLSGVITAAALTWNDASATDEYGDIFQVPFACSVDAIGVSMRLVDATSDFQINLTSTPLGTPASLLGGPLARVAETFSLAASEQFCYFPFAPVNLSANTDYCVSVKATGAGNIRWNRMVLPTAGSAVLIGAGGTTVYGVSRNDSTGAFGTATTTIMHPLAVRICDITAGAAGGVPMSRVQTGM